MNPYPRSPSPDGLTLKYLRGIEPPKKPLPISDILKPSIRDAPSFLLEEAKFYLQGDPNTTPVNILLEAKPGSKLVVEGYFVADRDQLNLLKRDGAGNHKNNSLVRFTNIAAYSVGDDPVTIWVASDDIWLEIRPQVKYLRKYNESTLAAKIYYVAVDFYKKMKLLKISSNSFNEPFEVIHEFLQCFSGTGSTLRDVARLLASSKRFFHDMIQNEHGGQSNIFFKWIAAGAPLSQIDGLPISGSSHHFSAVLTDTKRHELNSSYYQLTAPTPIAPPSLPSPPPPPAPIVEPTTHSSSSTSTSGCDWKSNRFPEGITPEDRFPITSLGLLSLIILSHCAESGKRSIAEHTTSYLHDRIYFGFGLTWRPVAREIIRRCPEQIITALGEPWADSPLVKDLRQGVVLQMPNEQKYVIELGKIMNGKKVIAIRNSKTKGTPAVSAPTIPRTARFARSATPISVSTPVENTTHVSHATRISPAVHPINVERNPSNRSTDAILAPKDKTAVKTSGYGKLAFEPFWL